MAKENALSFTGDTRAWAVNEGLHSKPLSFPGVREGAQSQLKRQQRCAMAIFSTNHFGGDRKEQ